MGDFLSPKRKEVFGRLRRRIELLPETPAKRETKRGRIIVIYFLFTTLGGWWGYVNTTVVQLEDSMGDFLSNLLLILLLWKVGGVYRNTTIV